MAVVVEQTIPFSSEVLDLQNSSRWNTLLPLMRSTIKAVPSQHGPTILVDETRARGNLVKVAAVGTLGQFSSELLDDRHVAAIVSQQSGSSMKSQDLVQAIEAAGVSKEHGFVIVRKGNQKAIDTLGNNVVIVETDCELTQDHILHLLGSVNESCRSSIEQMTELLKQVLDRASTAHSSFHHEKADGNPAVLHVGGAEGFEKARHAVERDLKTAMNGPWTASDDVVYSVHFSDVNGLSRLENYIVAGEIAKYLGSQKVQYSLSHSTVLNHSKSARGFSISICPVSSQYLAAQSQPQAHKSAPQAEDDVLQRMFSPSAAKMSFDDATVRQRIQNGCDAVIKEEPTITEYDTIVGDGDCGYTLRDGAKQVLSFIANKDLSRLPETVASLVHDLEVNMGGTSGALYCIYLTALAGALATETSIAKALKVALDQLLKYTRARLGDRTMMDALIPFIDAFEKTGDVDQAIAEAKKGVEGTKKMEAKLGRSTYLDESATQGVPDPGAYGLLVLLQGMAKN